MHSVSQKIHKNAQVKRLTNQWRGKQTMTMMSPIYWDIINIPIHFYSSINSEIFPPGDSNETLNV